MTTTIYTKTPRTLIAAGSTVAAGAGPARGTLDLRTQLGGVLTIKVTNGSTGPTVQAVANVLIAHNSGATPAAASAGSDWKTLASFGAGTTSNSVNEFPVVEVPAGAMHLEVEIGGNTGQAVTCEAFFSEITNAVTV